MSSKMGETGSHIGGNEPKSIAGLGFLTVLEHPEHGLFGGYLLLNPAGRPLEFHCTAPIKPNRAQEILYGPTLQSFLYGDQIGRTLLEKSKIEPLFICTDKQPVLAVREHISQPVALVLPSDNDGVDPADKTLRIDAAHPGGLPPGGPRLKTFQLGRNHLAVLERSAEDQRAISERFTRLADSFAEPFDLAEPFTRIREAIEEAQQGVLK
ncbi:MAG TPA: hypothetical protein VMY42_15795 [Thermoguttaceae bacterium]|nr:hypothetical protein [Thermoguttaceae bacterium]